MVNMGEVRTEDEDSGYKEAQGDAGGEEGGLTHAAGCTPSALLAAQHSFWPGLHALASCLHPSSAGPPVSACLGPPQTAQQQQQQGLHNCSINTKMQSLRQTWGFVFALHPEEQQG